MVLRCPKCGGTHLEFDDGLPEVRRCACGHAFAVADDRWQVEPLASNPRWLEERAEAA